MFGNDIYLKIKSERFELFYDVDDSQASALNLFELPGFKSVQMHFTVPYNILQSQACEHGEYS